MGGRAARYKGHQFERDWANLLKETGLDPTARRNVEETQVASVDIKTELPFGFQLKAWSKWRESPNVVLEQAAGGSNEHQTPIGVVKIDRKEPVVLMYKDDFINLLRLLYGLQ